MTDPSSPDLPRARLLRLLAEPQRIASILELADLPRDDVQVIRAGLFAAGLFVPAGRTPAELAGQLHHFGFQAIPAALTAPQPGDVYVVTDAMRTPERLGFVLKVGLAKDGTAASWVKSLDSSGEGRLETTAVDFWFRLPGG